MAKPPLILCTCRFFKGIKHKEMWMHYSNVLQLVCFFLAFINNQHSLKKWVSGKIIYFHGLIMHVKVIWRALKLSICILTAAALSFSWNVSSSILSVSLCSCSLISRLSAWDFSSSRIRPSQVFYKIKFASNNQNIGISSTGKVSVERKLFFPFTILSVRKKKQKTVPS